MHLLVSHCKRLLLSLAGVALCAVLSAAPQITFAADAPIAHWRFDEGSGTKVFSVAPVTITGSFMTPNPTWSTDVPSVSFTNPYSLKFESTGDGVSFAWPTALNFTGTDNRSFSFWYKPTMNGETASGNYDRIMSWSDDKFEIAGTYGDVSVHRLAFYDGSWRDTGYNLTVGTWYNITFTYDGTNVKLYVAGEEKFSGTSAGRDLSGTMYIGVRHTGDEGINGLIDDLRIYDYALTTDQINNIVAGSDDPDSEPTPVSSGSSGGNAQHNRLTRLLLQKAAKAEHGDKALFSDTEAPSMQEVGIFVPDSVPSVPVKPSVVARPEPAAERIPRKVIRALAVTSRLAENKVHASAPTGENPQSEGFTQRVCGRVLPRFSGAGLERVNARLMKRFGFECG